MKPSTSLTCTSKVGITNGYLQCGNEVTSAVSWSKRDQQEQPREP